MSYEEPTLPIMRPARNELDAMFLVARANPKAHFNNPGRGMGKHAVARFERSRVKAARAASRKFTPVIAPKVRRPVPYAQLSPKIDGVRYRYNEGKLVRR